MVDGILLTSKVASVLTLVLLDGLCITVIVTAGTVQVQYGHFKYVVSVYCVEHWCRRKPICMKVVVHKLGLHTSA